MTWFPPPGFVDLRSDTVTKPSKEMREAMAAAEVGNASWGEDPTVLELETASARAVGKEAALFVPSGTMANQAAVRVWTARHVAPEVILEAKSHLYLNEAAGIATVSHAQARPIASERGRMPVEAIEAAIAPLGNLKPETSLIALENSHNYHSGAALPVAYHHAVADLARRRSVPVHLDGARVFNAAVAVGVTAADVARHADSVQFCFSKGLGAPVGSVLCGSAEFVAAAAKVRQYLGGAMRQAGVLAAAALVGLRHEAMRLHEDHRRSRRLADGIEGANGLRFEPPETNILVVDVGGTGLDAAGFAARLRERGVGFSVIGPREVRAVTHRDVDDDGIERAIAAARAVAADA